jgi:hypothetical protein
MSRRGRERDAGKVRLWREEIRRWQRRGRPFILNGVDLTNIKRAAPLPAAGRRRCGTRPSFPTSLTSYGRFTAPPLTRLLLLLF